MQPFFVTSGNMTADRRYEFAQQYFKRGDLDAAADVMAQAVELAPHFAAAWFALGEINDARGRREEAIAAFRKAREHDRDDRHGATLHLMRLGAEDMGEMPEAYVRTLFDQYAPEFNRALLETLNYRGPRVLRDARQGGAGKASARGTVSPRHRPRLRHRACGARLCPHGERNRRLRSVVRHDRAGAAAKSL